LLVLLLPIIIKWILKKNFYKCILLSFIGVVVYFIILEISLFSISIFSENKWKNDKYINLRYFMIEDLEKKYDFIGMNKMDVIDVLGNGYFSSNELCYQIGSIMVSTYYYCLKYDENVIVDVYEKYVD